MQAGEPPYLQGLNAEQREAVLALDGPVLVLAGAGTGKTRVLTTRLAHILATRRAWPSQILAVTFTNKAAREMKERIGALVGGVIEGMPWLGTFHSIGARILRRHAELAGLKSNFTILDADDQLRLLKQIVSAENIDEKRWPARTLAALIDGWKNRALTPADVSDTEAQAFAFGKARDLYKLYQDRLKALNAADFGDLLLEPISILRTNREILAEYQSRFAYMLVDEYQDTNVAQYLWLRLLAGGTHNICVVGDDDQSIYAWRGAEVENILRFERDFPGAKVIRLERNYRSTPDILGAASGLIAANRARLGKTLWTDDTREPGDKIRVKGLWDAEEEARDVASEAENLHRRGHIYAEMAVLVRASFQMREFEDRFLALGIPYRVVGGPRFYERAEIRDALAYLRVIAQGDDDLAFERIINKPKRGLGDAALQMLHNHARQTGLPLFQAAEQLSTADELTPKARHALRELIATFLRWRETSAHVPHAELAEMVLDESGYTDMLKTDKTPEAAGRLENLKELVRSMESFESLAAFLEHVSLVMELEQNESADRLNLMTLHAAKGLEFETVFLPGWEEGLFPSQRTLDEKGTAGLEEERRLAYVGLTRAKHRAFISFAANRRVHGTWQNAMPSRFVSELPQNHIENLMTEGFYGNYGNFRDNAGMNEARPMSNFAQGGDFGTGGYSSPGWRRAAQNREARGRGPVIDAKAKVVRPEEAGAQHGVGERVFHQKFGYGRIRAVEGNKLLVDFEKAGEKRVMDGFVTRA
jgi:DNA helicase-2/ATP-dependent DNA helicase PcrA